ncbi:hypothetical protein [Kitasatospora sp. NPDC094016]|uniref:hypothetical protein n=1 Tax=Kitasatospora sp. NPDC094016 TaxID=3154986 RepID=UPI0033188120
MTCVTREGARGSAGREPGYTGSANLLVCRITQGRAGSDKPGTTPQRFARLLLTRPERLRDKDAALLRELTGSCSGITELAHFAREFAQLLTQAAGGGAKLADDDLDHVITAPECSLTSRMGRHRRSSRFDTTDHGTGPHA